MNIFKKISKRINKWLYFAIAKKMPETFSPGGKFACHFRVKTARHFVVSIGKNVNIEKGASVSIFTFLPIDTTKCLAVFTRK